MLAQREFIACAGQEVPPQAVPETGCLTRSLGLGPVGALRSGGSHRLKPAGTPTGEPGERLSTSTAGDRQDLTRRDRTDTRWTSLPCFQMGENVRGLPTSRTAAGDPQRDGETERSVPAGSTC